MKYGLIVQGPLVSEGRTGETVLVPARDVGPEHIVRFNCLSVLQDYVSRFGKTMEICLVVWKEDFEHYQSEIERFGLMPFILVLEDKSKKIAPRRGLLPMNNKYRQFFSTLHGLKELLKRGCRVVVKVRSDQVVDVNQLIRDFEFYSQRRRRFILVSEFLLKKKDWLADFFFVGEAQLLERALSRYLEQEELFESVHHDIFYSFSRTMSPLAVRLAGSRVPILRRSALFWIWKKFPLASRSVSEAIEWRGKKVLSAALDGRLFREDLLVSETRVLWRALGKKA